LNTGRPFWRLKTSISLQSCFPYPLNFSLSPS
jgi:hypothetical protein